MSRTYKAGDYARCVIPTEWLFADAVYRVNNVADCAIWVDGSEKVTGWISPARFIPWTPQAGDVVRGEDAYEYVLGKAIIVGQLFDVAQTNEPDATRASRIAMDNPHHAWRPVLGRAPAKIEEKRYVSPSEIKTDEWGKILPTEKPREFQVGDVADCLPDAEWEKSGSHSNVLYPNVAYQRYGRGTVRGFAKGNESGRLAIFRDLSFTWPVRSLKLIKAVEGSCDCKVTHATPEKEGRSQQAPLPAIDPDAEFWRRHQASFAARNFPPLTGDGRPMEKGDAKLFAFMERTIKERESKTISDCEGERQRNEREARKYAGWRGE